jgi:hypothetical protein
MSASCDDRAMRAVVAEQDRMSSAELEQLYPELALIDPQRIAGKTACAFCSGAFPMELLRCPHCGAEVGGKKS